jgi:hypothetical protein
MNGIEVICDVFDLLVLTNFALLLNSFLTAILWIYFLEHIKSDKK